MLWHRSAAVLAACVVAVWSGWIRGQEPGSAPGSRIDAGCTEAPTWVQTHPGAARLFGATSSGDGYEPKHSTWREYPSQAALDKAGEGGNLFYIASVWTLPSGTIFVQTEQSSFSGDWGLHVDYCFRESGISAKVVSELRMLPSRAITRQTMDYDARGREVGRRTTRHDLHTEAELDAERAKEAREFEVFPTPVYRRVSDLPFFTMFAKRR